MKKLLLLLPVSLLAVSGFFWITHNSTPPKKPSSVTYQPMQKGVRELFSLNESAQRKIIHHGDTSSIALAITSLNALESKLQEHKKAGYSITKIETILTVYKEDSISLAKTFTPHIEALRQCDQFEHTHEQSFLASVDQIGLYELKSAYLGLNSIRNRYLKEPTMEDSLAYEHENEHLHQIITELYLDTPLEKPLLTYLDNHKRYFDIIATAYDEIGYDRINRLHTNAYAIKSELQLFPSI